MVVDQSLWKSICCCFVLLCASAAVVGTSFSYTFFFQLKVLQTETNAPAATARNTSQSSIDAHASANVKEVLLLPSRGSLIESSKHSFAKLPQVPYHRSKKQTYLPMSVLTAGLRFHGDSAGLHAMLLRLQRRDPVTVHVFGGSFTQGKGCTPDADLPLPGCRWSDRLRKRLLRAFPRSKLTVTNFGSSGCTTSCTVRKVAPISTQARERGERSPDLVILDHAVNDRKIGYSYRGADCLHKDNQKLCYANVANETSIALEVLIREYLERRPQPQIIVFIALPYEPRGSLDVKFLAAAYEWVCRYYDVPLLSYLHSMKAFAQTRGKWKAMWSGGSAATSHPDFQAHTYVADLFTHFMNTVSNKHPQLLGNLTKLLPAPLHTKSELNRYIICETVSRHVARMNSSEGSRRRKKGKKEPSIAQDSGIELGDGWRLYEDRPQKPGWIANGTSGQNAIVFPVKFGPKALLFITFLKSYEGFGQASIWLDDARQSYTLDGFWQARSSQSFTVQFNASGRYKDGQNTDDAGLEAGFGVLPFSHSSVHIKLAEGIKFKVLSVQTC